jgi:hypothetical protein
MVAGPLEQLQLLERQDMALISKKELLAESIWSTQLGTHRPVDPGHFQFRCTAIGPAGLNRVRVLVGRFVPVGWPRHKRKGSTTFARINSPIAKGLAPSRPWSE